MNLPDESDCYHRLARYIPDIATVLDVGAAEGSIWMYFRDTALFQQAKHVFIDCMAENEPIYQKIGQHFNTDYVIGAMGDQAGTVDIRIDRSPYLTQRADHVQTGYETLDIRSVPCDRLDRIAAMRGWAGPFLLRMDVQGAEQFVLAGAEGLVPDTPVITVEISFFAPPESTVRVWEWLARHDYVPYALNSFDFASPVYRLTSAYLIAVKRMYLPPDTGLMMGALARTQHQNAGTIIHTLGHACRQLQELMSHGT